MRGIFLALILPLVLAACGAEPVWAPDAEVQRAAYRSDEPPSLTLYTVISNRSGAGAHSGLLVNASQRVMFDPAGTFKHPRLPERNDVIFGMSPAAVDFYVDYHARETFNVVIQKVPVSAEVAELVLRRVQEYGPVAKGHCSDSTTRILKGIPGFEDIPQTYFPKRVMAYFDTKPGVVRDVVYDDSPASNKTILAPAL